MAGNAGRRDGSSVATRIQNDSLLGGSSRLVGPADQQLVNLESDLGLDVVGDPRARVDLTRDRDYVARVDVVRGHRWEFGVTQFGEAVLLAGYRDDRGRDDDLETPDWLRDVLRFVGAREVEL